MKRNNVAINVLRGSIASTKDNIKWAKSHLGESTADVRLYTRIVEIHEADITALESAVDKLKER